MTFYPRGTGDDLARPGLGFGALLLGGGAGVAGAATNVWDMNAGVKALT